MQDYARSIEELAHRYNLAEQRVVSDFFGRTRNVEDQIHWLKAQAFKEYSAIKPIVKALDKLYPQLDKQVDRHDYEELCEKLADETKHARLIMDFLEELAGRRLTQKDLTWLPEDQKLAQVRGRYSKSYAALLHGSERITTSEIRRDDEALERAAITLTEGGGGALYEVCRRLHGDRIRRKIAAIFKEIHRDELKHKDSGGDALGDLIKTKRDFQRVLGIIRTVSSQRLRMRNEQFGHPLTDSALKALDKDCRTAV